MSLLTVRSSVGVELDRAVQWDEYGFPDATFPVLRTPDMYSVKIQVFAGRGHSDFVAASSWPLLFLADHVMPGATPESWTATVSVQHMDHVRLAKRHRVPTMATLRLLV